MIAFVSMKEIVISFFLPTRFCAGAQFGKTHPTFKHI